MSKVLRVRMLDGTLYDVPVETIIQHRAVTISRDENIPIADVVAEPVTDEQLLDWAHDRMGWSDVVQTARPIVEMTDELLQRSWRIGEKAVIECLDGVPSLFTVLASNHAGYPDRAELNPATDDTGNANTNAGSEPAGDDLTPGDAAGVHSNYSNAEEEPAESSEPATSTESTPAV